MARRKRNNKGAMTVAEAGRRGGEQTAKTHGEGFYKNIGAKGGRARARKLKEKSRTGR